MIQLDAKNMIRSQETLNKFRGTLECKAKHCYKNYDVKRLDSLLNTLRSMDEEEFEEVSDRLNTITNRILVDLPYTSNKIINNMELLDDYLKALNIYINFVNKYCEALMQKRHMDYYAVLTYYNLNQKIINDKIQKTYSEKCSIDDELFYCELYANTTYYVHDALERIHSKDVNENMAKSPLVRRRTDDRKGMTLVNRVRYNVNK